jgi:hypothetical protein
LDEANLWRQFQLAQKKQELSLDQGKVAASSMALGDLVEKTSPSGMLSSDLVPSMLILSENVLVGSPLFPPWFPLLTLLVPWVPLLLLHSPSLFLSS